MKTGMKSYRVTGPTRAKPPDAEATAPCPSGNQAPSLKWAAEVEPSEFVAFRECQDLFRKRLTAPLLKTIAQLTGLRLHVLWHDPLDFQGLGARPVLCPMARQRAGAEGRRPKYCESCLRRHWKLTLRQANRGRRFIGQCGITNFCACLQVDNACPLTLVLQARVVSCSNRTCSRTMNPGVAASRQSAAIVREESQRRSAETPLRGYGPWKGESVSPTAFHDAVALARLILHDLESTAQARMARSGLDNALRRLNSTQIEAARLRGELRHRLPSLPESTVQPGLGSHARKLVTAMLDYAHQHYHRPIGLGELASAMKMNASYLSALFSRTTGVTFHRFLEEVRLSKAKELLRDPRNLVCEVACATGYASLDSFRHAFKAHEGLSPEAWRAGQ
jgi:AraC-like DNA-binding protein